MSKNIVVCCDGTGNEYGDTNSNVVKLYSTLMIDGAHQIGYYHPGVGTMGAPTARNRIEAAWSVLMGLAFGAGLLRNVGDAYRFIMNSYAEGDRIFLFGFSRGAYTARAVAGLIHMFGLLCPGNEGLIPYMLRTFARHSRAAAGMQHTFEVAEGFKATFSRECRLHFVGVWDTVSSVGWIWDPLRLPYTARNPAMLTGRHAVSIDERRCYFVNNLWGEPFDGQHIRQVWFAGVHSDVGGSYPEAESGLSKIALEWMLREACDSGLLVDEAKVEYILGRNPPPPPMPPHPLAKIHESLHGFGWWLLEFLPHRSYEFATGRERIRIPRGASRVIPENSVLHNSVKARMEANIGYRPKNLPVNFTFE